MQTEAIKNLKKARGNGSKERYRSFVVIGEREKKKAVASIAKKESRVLFIKQFNIRYN